MSLDNFFQLRDQTRTEQNITQKGILLEQLVSSMMSSLSGLEVTFTDVRTPDEEIDIVLLNLKKCDAFSNLPNDIFIECKNWSTPIGVPEVDHFMKTLERSGVEFGIFVARYGITGNKFKDAQNIILQERKSKRRVIVITWENIENITSVEDIYDMIKVKYGSLLIGKLSL